MESTFLLGLGWMGGLLSRSLPYGSSLGWIAPLLVALVGAFCSRHRLPLLKTWMLTGLIGVVAWGYLAVRIPQPVANDVSLQAPQKAATVVGKIISSPRTTRSERVQFSLEAQQLTPPDGDPTDVAGTLYVTVNPKVLGTLDIHPSQIVALQGSLYVPTPAQNPGAFDFKAYLNKQGIFAGFSVTQLEIKDPGSPYGGWAMRRRISQAMIAGLGQENGELLSSLVIGSRAADLDPQLSDAFREVGLAHILAASGFQVSMLVGVVVAALSSRPPMQRKVIALLALGLYVVLTGVSPPVLRAAVMGVAAVLFLSDKGMGTMDVRLQPLGMLLLSGVVLLVWNPAWINDLGFQLSFLATFGLMVGVDPIVKRLPWLPPTLATALAVPLAAQLWVLPILMVVFGKINNYFLIANLITLPFVTILSVVGFAICAVALVVPALGSLLAAPLQVLLTPLTNLVLWMNTWPYTSHYTGPVSWPQAILMYGALFSLTFWPRWRATIRWQGTLTAMALIFWIPSLWPGPAITVTTLSADYTPVMVIRAQGETVVINSGSSETVERTLLPYLRQQGIRQIEDGVALTGFGRDNEGWGSLTAAIPVRQLWDDGGAPEGSVYLKARSEVEAKGGQHRELKPGDKIDTQSSISLQVVQTAPLILKLTTHPDQPDRASRWILLGSANERAQKRMLRNPLVQPPNQWLWTEGEKLDPDLLDALQVEGGIVTSRRALPAVETWFENRDRPLYSISRVGAVRWTESGITVTQQTDPG